MIFSAKKNSGWELLMLIKAICNNNHNKRKKL